MYVLYLCVKYLMDGVIVKQRLRKHYHSIIISC